jgi:hypothetical protein
LDFNVLKIDSSSNLISYLFPPAYKLSDLNDLEIIKCEKLLSQFIDEYNKDAKLNYKGIMKQYPETSLSEDDLTIKLNEYSRQFIPVANERGQKIIYVNCFCHPEEYEYRDKYLVEVMDGGICYFNFKIDLDEMEILDFMVNGFG